MKTLFNLLFISTLLMLTACGSGGGAGSTNPSTIPIINVVPNFYPKDGSYFDWNKNSTLILESHLIKSFNWNGYPVNNIASFNGRNPCMTGMVYIKESFAISASDCTHTESSISFVTFLDKIGFRFNFIRQ